MKVAYFVVLAGSLAALAACGPTPEQQAAMDAAQRYADQQKCAGFGFAPGTESFAHCMMQTAGQRDAIQAADRRAAAIQNAADQRARAAQQAAKDQADRDAWDARTGQGKYASPSFSPYNGKNYPDPNPYSASDDAQRAAFAQHQKDQEIKQGEDLENADAQKAGFGTPDLSGMNCTSSSNTTGSANNSETTSNTSCHN